MEILLKIYVILIMAGLIAVIILLDSKTMKRMQLEQPELLALTFGLWILLGILTGAIILRSIY